MAKLLPAPVTYLISLIGFNSNSHISAPLFTQQASVQSHYETSAALGVKPSGGAVGGVSHRHRDPVGAELSPLRFCSPDRFYADLNPGHVRGAAGSTGAAATDTRLGRDLQHRIR